MSFLSETPRADLEDLAAWLHGQGLDATVGGWSDKEFFLDVPAAFVDFVIEAMTPEMAEYGAPGKSQGESADGAFKGDPSGP
ncbi:MAG: hypothetical protein ACLGHY_01200 [Gammaproteobacteria bacterium]